MAGRPRNAVVLDEDERTALLTWTRSRNCSQALALRARIVLTCEQESTSTAVAEQLGVSPDMVRKWRSRFVAERLEGLTERRRPGRPPQRGDAAVTEVLARLLDPAPGGRRWSTHSMATAVGVSQTTVSRIWRTYRIGSRHARSAPGQEVGHTPLPTRIRDIVGLYLDPPARVLAVAADGDAAPRGEHGTTTASTPSMQRRTAKARETFAVANAFAQINGSTRAGASADGEGLRGFLERLERSVPASLTIHLLVDGLSPADQSTLANQMDEHPRFRRHAVVPQGSWLNEIDFLLAHNPLPNHENVLGYGASLDGLREEIRAWCRTSTPAARPFAWTKSPRSLWRGDRDYHGLINDSDRRNDVHVGDLDADHEASDASSEPGSATPRIADRVAQLVREELAGGRFKPGERVKEAPLAARIGVSRGPVREALRVLAEEGMLEQLPNRGVAVPRVSAENIIDLYALRASVGGLLLRRIAMRPRSELRAVGTALAEVQSVAHNKDHAQIGEADLRFQDVIARTAQLSQTGVIFERLTMRLRMFNSVLQLDWAEAVDLIAREDTGLHEAIRNGDGDEAARRWRVKVERSVRYMVSQLPQDHFDPSLWTTLVGKPPLRRGDPRGAH